jgi:hypothetical protein
VAGSSRYNPLNAKQHPGNVCGRNGPETGILSIEGDTKNGGHGQMMRPVIADG